MSQGEWFDSFLIQKTIVKLQMSPQPSPQMLTQKLFEIEFKHIFLFLDAGDVPWPLHMVMVFTFYNYMLLGLHKKFLF